MLNAVIHLGEEIEERTVRLLWKKHFIDSGVLGELWEPWQRSVFVYSCPATSWKPKHAFVDMNAVFDPELQELKGVTDEIIRDSLTSRQRLVWKELSDQLNDRDFSSLMTFKIMGSSLRCFWLTWDKGRPVTY